ncbi:wrt-4 [Pristionchus pacificus]|uniref:Wrt-4 n=1 Tax=Pristionchus pacificus TaxID=54126 RepID=A0A2A6B4G8_PRIPA|nr:wrt-4 [Pristionchus pacificus]|eukprot:PDM60764.1 wrt-4 [Pristionchus pacificus]
MLRLLTSSLLVALSSASFCGDSAIPFSLEILGNGQPILGCARPTCFGWAPTGKPASNTGSFYRINNNADGFIRNGIEQIPAFGPADPRYYRSQTAICEQAFASQNCPGLNQWVSGIAPLVNVTAFPTVVQCCSFDGLLQSEDRGLATVKGGQIVQGGEVVSSGVQVGFDYISDLVKIVRADGSLQYDVSIRRMPCTDYTQPAVTNKIYKGTEGGAQAFQDPNVEVEQPLPLPIQGGPQAPQAPTAGTQNAILEEVVQEEAFQLPPGTQFQPALQPPPVQQPPLQPAPIMFQAPQFVPQAPQYYSPPVSYYSGGGGGGQWCFSADMTVFMLDGTRKRMDELKRNDWVLAVNEDQLEFVPVEFWLHRVPEQVAEFNEFELDDGRIIKLTDKHYIFKGDCSRVGTGPVPMSAISDEAITADQVHVGDCLYAHGRDRNMHEVRIVRKARVTQTGIYAPMTASGRIVVNGIHASCHNIMQAHSMGHTVFGYFDILNDVYDSLFGYNSNEIVETPTGLNTILQMADLFMPKNLVTL